MRYPRFSLGREIPFLTFLLPLILGIITGWNIILFPIFHPFEIIIAFMAVAIIVLMLIDMDRKRKPEYATIRMVVFLFFFGCFLSWWHTDSLRTDYAGHYLTDSSIVKIKLESPLSESAHSWKAEARILAVENGQKIQSTIGEMYVYFPKQQHQPGLKYGDVLVIPNRLSKIKNSGNPGSFNYKRYCKANNIGFSAYLPKHDWLLVDRNRGNKMKAFFLHMRMKCMKILKKYVTSDRESGVAGALLLGYRADLNPELVQAFANIGVVHLISISGLHVGLIYLVLLWLLKFFPKRTKRLQGLLICICLWSFTLLTGAHPSTLRATIMLTFFVIGQFFFDRKANGFNTLAASAFVLLCINPLLLFDVGFQLSYLAVAGILAFQQPIRNLIWFKNKAFNYFWEMISVSLAAQILVFPLVLFYFHQFPTIFLLSNLLLIPVATFVLYGEIILLLVSFFPPVAEIIGVMVTKVLFFMNESVLLVNRYPFVHVEYYDLTSYKLLLLYLFIGFICLWLFYKNKKAFVWGLAVVTVFSIYQIGNYWRILNQKEMAVYNIQGHSVYEVIHGRESLLFCDSMVLNQPDIIDYTLHPSATAFHIEHRKGKGYPKNFFTFRNKKFVSLNKTFHPDSLFGFFQSDYVFLSKYNRLSMKDVALHFAPISIIFDGSVRKWQEKRWKSACKKLNLHCFSVINKGAWLLSLEK